MKTVSWTTVLLLLTVLQIGRCLNESMKCTYGERGSLTVTCFNATPNFFKVSSYKFDHLDETLKCVDCVLTVIDSGTFDVAGNEIKHLDLRNSKIETIKNRAFAGLIFMEELDLSHNFIRQISPGTFTAIKKVRSLNLSNNLVNVLNEDGFAELENLELLNLQNNLIQMIVPKAFNGLTSLLFIDLRYNDIKDISPEIFSNLSRLQILNLGYNKLTSLKGKEFYNLTHLLGLDLSHNQISAPVVEFVPGSSLRMLNLSYNKVEKIDNSSLVRMTLLEILDLSFNQIHTLTKYAFQNMFNLHSLYFAYNNLSKFETGTFTGLPQLRFLNCSHNNIDSVKVTGVFSLNSLHTLDISYNKITDFDYDLLISRLPRITYLRIEGNSLPCSLEAEITSNLFQDNIKFILKDENTRCTDKPTMRQTYVKLLEDFVHENYDSLTTAEIWIVVFLSIIFVVIGVLFYLQYKTRNETYSHRPLRATSTVNLISEMEVRDDGE